MLLASLLSGCDACERHKPYVPYAIDGGATDGAMVVAPESPPAPPVEAPPVETAPNRASRWRLGGSERSAPSGKHFTTGVALVSGGALAVAREAESDPGELLYYPRSSEQGESLVRSDAVARGGCDARSTLTSTGHLVLVELGCALRALPPPGLISRVVAIVKTVDRPIVRASLGFVDPPETSTLSVAATSPDLDHDGVGDLVLDVTLGPAVPPFEPTPTQALQLRWFDRPAGLSRDLDAAADPFANAVKAVSARIAKGKELAGVAAEIAQIRNLARSFCSEFGALRVRRISGDRLECGPSKSLAELPLLLVRAALGRKDVLRAALALDDVEPNAKLKDVERQLARLTRPIDAKIERRLLAVPMLPQAGGPSVGPVNFIDDTSLLVRTGSGVVRALPATGEEAAADGVASWPDLALSPNGRWRWTSLSDSCDGGHGRATFVDAGGQSATLAVPIAGRLQATCPPLGVPLTATPLSWTPKGLIALAGGEVIHVLPSLGSIALASPNLFGDGLKGGPASADGRSVVWPTRFGFVITGEPPQLLKLDAPVKARWCAVSPARTRVACVVGSAVEVYLAESKTLDKN
jgi:hypothetical protein